MGGVQEGRVFGQGDGRARGDAGRINRGPNRWLRISLLVVSYDKP